MTMLIVAYPIPDKMQKKVIGDIGTTTFRDGFLDVFFMMKFVLARTEIDIKIECPATDVTCNILA